MVMSENGRDFSRVARRKNRAIFVRPQKVAFGETSEVGRKRRELKEPLVSPAVSGSLNTWSQDFPKTRNRKHNFFPPPPSTPTSRQVFPQINIFRLESFPPAGNVQRSLKSQISSFSKTQSGCGSNRRNQGVSAKKRLQDQVWLGVGISKRVLHISRFIDSLFPKGYTFIRS